MKIQELMIGTTLCNRELAETFQCSTQGGMRRSKRTNSLVLISDRTKLYQDKWQGDILHYTGMGQVGDQDFFFMQNRTLYESENNGIDIYLFEVLSPKEYTYCGMFKLASMPYMNQQYDALGNMRNVCVFPIKRR